MPTDHHATNHPPRGAAHASRGVASAGMRPGFSLIELIAVLVILGIVISTMIMGVGTTDATRRSAAAWVVVRDLAYARERAIATGTTHWVAFTPASDSYTALVDDTSNPGFANALALSDPATGAAFARTLNINEYLGVEITSASFGASDDLGFDWRGRPIESDADPLAADGTVTLTGGLQIVVERDTGRVSHDPP